MQAEPCMAEAVMWETGGRAGTVRDGQGPPKVLAAGFLIYFQALQNRK